MNLPRFAHSPNELRDIHKDAQAAVNTVQSERAIRVCIVDNRAQCAETIGMTLEYLGYDVRVCNSGTEAPDAVKRLWTVLANLDIRWPDIPCYELLEVQP